ncbi:MAG: NADH-quinone oxidoreductase subunit C [Candidatus Omnitrophica bacterium]|nr:NADH-quinone oxidoreductase subunit C [Candidatus Omnitrophota bacterium]
MDEAYIYVKPENFKKACLYFHKKLSSPVVMMFACDERQKNKCFRIYCVFMGVKYKKWVFVTMDTAQDTSVFESIARDIYSAGLFEREIKEMFGILPKGNPDLRSLRLHDEVWPEGFYPLRKDFEAPKSSCAEKKEYVFNKVEGEGVFEVPVGPVHAGIIPSGHFRFSCAGEPIINLEARLGWTHKGIEKLFEGKDVNFGVELSECVAGDSAFSNSNAFCHAVEKIYKIDVPEKAMFLRTVFLELERMYNHLNGIGGIAIDVGFSFPAMYASVMKENLLCLNKKLTGSRYLKGVNIIGGVSVDLTAWKKKTLLKVLEAMEKDFRQLKNMLYSSVSFMDRLDGTGVLKKKTAEDLGVLGLAARSSGIERDLRKDFPGVYSKIKFNAAKEHSGDVMARFNIRVIEFEESMNLIKQFVDKIGPGSINSQNKIEFRDGVGLGYIEAWRGPLFYWVKLSKSGIIERCKIVDPSFHNWEGLCYSVLGNIIPDFPVCNKSFDLSYSGNDL